MENNIKKIKRNTYRWRGVNLHGVRMRGESTTSNLVQLRSELHNQGIVIEHLSKISTGLFPARKQKILTTDITVFCRQVAIMLDAGVPVIEALDAIGKDYENPAMRDLIKELRDDIFQGSSMSDAFGRHKKYFDPLFVSFILVGEQAGCLVMILNNLAAYKEKTDAMRSKVKKAMMYPITVIALAIIVALVLLIFVVPQFEELFKSFGAQLPAFTRAVLNVSRVVQHYWILLFMFFGGLVYSMKRFRRTSPRFLYITDEWMLNLPIVGKIFRNAIIARLTRTMGISYSAGIPIADLLKSLPHVAGNAVFANAMLQIRESVCTGEPLCKSMQALHIFPSLVIQMIAVGENSGSLDKMLVKVANYYETEVDTMVESLSSLLEPIVMAVLGVLIGCFVAAMYLPIFKLGSIV